jgi:iron complex outermembrane receptor protein
MHASLTWDIEPFSASVRVTHINGYTNTASPSTSPNQHVGSYTPVDLNFTWRFGQDGKLPLQIGAEIRNVFDQKPPYVNIAPSVNGSGGYDATTTDPVGRFFALSARIKY